MTRTTFLLLLCSTLAAARLEGTDIAYGTDALPQLVSDATLICTAAGSGARRNTSRGTLVDVRVKAVIHGDFSGTRLRIFGPRSLGGVPDVFAGTLVFVFGPLTTDQKAEWELPMEQTIYQLVGGTLGVIGSTPSRRRALDQYLAKDDTHLAHRIAWAKTYLTVSDGFLQRSAIVELERQPPDDAVVDLLGDAARSADVSLANGTRAVDAIAAAASEHAFSQLRTIAETSNLRTAVRVASVDAIRRLPGGDAQIARWAVGKDRVLATAAARVQEH